MALRIAVGGFLHESATFVDQPTTWDDFARTGPWPGACEGEAMLDDPRGAEHRRFPASSMRRARPGHDDRSRSHGRMAQPAGPVTAHAFERMSATLVDGYRRSGADVIFVELHGAMVADELRRRRGRAAAPHPRRGRPRCAGRRHARPARQHVRPDGRDDQPALGLPHLSACRLGRDRPRASRAGSTARSRGDRAPRRRCAACRSSIPVTAGCSLISPVKELYETLGSDRGRDRRPSQLHARLPAGRHRGLRPGRVRLRRRSGDRASARSIARRRGDRRRAGLRRAARAAGRRSGRECDRAFRPTRTSRWCSPTRRTIPARARRRTPPASSRNCWRRARRARSSASSMIPELAAAAHAAGLGAHLNTPIGGGP